MKYLPLFLLVVCLHAIAQNPMGGQHLSPADLAKKKQEIEDNNKKQIPNILTEEAFNKLKITTPMCEPQKMTQSISACSYHKCMKKMDLMGMMIIYSELIVHGFNSNGNCVISGLGKRYFVPKKDLLTFAKIFLENTNMDSLSVHATASMGGSTSAQTFKVDGKPCKIKAEYRNDVDPSNTEIVKFSPAKKDGMESTIKDGKTETYYTTNGKTYRVKSGELNLIPKLVNYALEKESVATCKDLGATLFFDLEKQGLTQNLPKPTSL